MAQLLTIIALGGAALLWLLRQVGAMPSDVAPPPAAGDAPAELDVDALPSNRQLTKPEVLELARVTVDRFGLRSPVDMLVTMAWIESSFRPWVIGDEGRSFGLMQLLDEPRDRSTAQWLARDLGFNAYGSSLPRSELLRPQVSMYLGAAYVHWLSRYRGIARSEQWIVRAYNGGPGWESASSSSLSNTLRHWNRYLAAKAQLGFS